MLSAEELMIEKRNTMIYENYLQGYTYDLIAIVFNINVVEVMDIVHEVEDLLNVEGVKCPSCNKRIMIKESGHGRCECGSHVKYLKE